MKEYFATVEKILNRPLFREHEEEKYALYYERREKELFALCKYKNMLQEMRKVVYDDKVWDMKKITLLHKKVKKLQKTQAKIRHLRKEVIEKALKLDASEKENEKNTG